MKKAQRKAFHSQIVDAIKKGDLDQIKNIVAAGYIFNEDVEQFNPTVDDNRLALIAVLESEHDILEYLVVEAGLDPAVKNNIAIKTAYEMNDDEAVAILFMHPYVREELYFECKDSLSLPEVKFLLTYYEEVEGAKELYEDFIEDDEDASFGDFSEEESAEFDSELDDFLDEDDSESREGMEQVRELLLDVKQQRAEKKRREMENPFGF